LREIDHEEAPKAYNANTSAVNSQKLTIGWDLIYAFDEYVHHDKQHIASHVNFKILDINESRNQFS
jgi:hypothetical protein